MFRTVQADALILTRPILCPILFTDFIVYAYNEKFALLLMAEMVMIYMPLNVSIDLFNSKNFVLLKKQFIPIYLRFKFNF